MPADAREDGILYELQRIGGTGVLGNFVGAEIEQPRVGINRDVFQDGAEADGAPDLRLILAREPDAFRITAALEIEDPAVAPAVLVVADEPPPRVGRKRGLARSGKAEEEGYAAIHAHIGGTVHGEHVARGQQVIQYRKDGFFHLACIAGT